jgi:diguanylate cyclase (GGDEF)-like protein/PAS domain S-box-containing protein
VFADSILRIHSVRASPNRGIALPHPDGAATSSADRSVSDALELLGAWLGAAVCCCDAQFVILGASERYAQLLRGKPADLAGVTLATVTGGTNWNLIHPYLERALAGEQVVITASAATVGLTRAPSQIEFRPWRNERNEPRGVLIAVRDVDALALAAVPELERTPQPTALFDASGALIWNNAPIAILLGEALHNLSGQRPVQRLELALRALLETTLTEGMAIVSLLEGRGGNEPRRLRFEMRREAVAAGDAARIWLIASEDGSEAIDDAANSPIELYSSNAFDGIPEAVTIFDRERHLRFANQAFLDLVGKSRAEIIGRPISEIADPAIALRRADSFERALQGEIVSLESFDDFGASKGWREIRFLPLRLPDGQIDGVYVASHGIDERKRLQGSLREQSSRSRVLADNVPAQISYLGPDRRFRYVNHRFLVDNGLSESEVIGRTPRDIFGAETDDQLQSRLDAAIRGERVQFERRSPPGSGDPRWWRVSIVADIDEAGALQGTYGIAYDITEARSAQERLLQQQQWIESFIENFPQALGYVDPAGTYRYANRAFAELLCKAKPAIIGALAQDAFPSEATSSIQAALTAAANGVARRSEHAMSLDGAARRWIAIDWLPDRDEKGQLRGLYTLSQDVSEAKRAQLDYERSVQEMQRAMDSVALPISFVDTTERIRFVNHTTTIWHGRRPDELVGLALDELLSEADYRFAKPYIDAALAGQSIQYEREMRYHDGIRRWVLLRYVPTRDDSGRVTGFYTTATDIQARKQQELALQQANWLLTAHFENTPLASFTLDADERVTRWSSQAEALFGWRRDEVLEHSFWDTALLDATLAATFFPKSEAKLGTESSSQRHIAIVKRRDGTEAACEWHIAALRDTRGRVTSILGLVQDISQRVEAEKRLIEIAQRDTLTKLLNRHALEPTLTRFIEKARRKVSGVALLFIDLDHFKNINDTLGHRVGDLMLVEIASILRRCVRAEDEVARIGGDEFMVIIGHERPKAIAHETAQRLIQALREPMRVENQRLSVAASIGVAVYPDHGRTPEALLRSADLAMYKAKENGKDRFEFFSASLAQHSERRAGIKSALRLALQRDALRLYYQPRVAVADGRMVGAEALLRWNDPRLGPIKPKEFINVAEESGLIHELGIFVFRKACQQIRDWQVRGLPIGTISVNFSARQLLVASFIDEVDLVIEQTGCDPRSIEVEITETSMLFDLGVTKNVIADLKHRGMRIAIDDFGTGYSSLSHLQQLEIDTLKIDQSFIRDMLDDASDFAITRSVISLGQGLGLEVVAEGVENERQLNALRQAGCDHYQGFHFSPAVVVEDLEVLLAQNANRTAP